MRVKIVKEGAESTFGNWKDKPADETWGKKPSDEESEEISDPEWDPDPTVSDDPDATMQIKKPEDYVANPDDPSESEMKAAMDAYMARNSAPWKHLEMVGFEGVRELGRGQFGVVYSADHPSGREMAVKAVEKDNIGYDREMKAYRTIGEARDDHKAIAKHFPLIYAIDEKSHDQYSFIVMERLTDEGPYADLIRDLFSGSEYLVHPRGDLMAKGAWKDLSKRMKTYFSNDQSRDKIIDTIFNGTPEDYIQDIKQWAGSWQAWRDIGSEGKWDEEGGNFGSIAATAKKIVSGMDKAAAAEEDEEMKEHIEAASDALSKGYYNDALEALRNSTLRAHPQAKVWRKKLWDSGIWLTGMAEEYLLYSDRDALQDEFGNLKREFQEEPWMAYFILGALKKLKEYRPTYVDPVWQDTSKGEVQQDWYWTMSTGIINGWVDFMRKRAPIGIHHKPEDKRQDRGGAPEEVGDVYEQARSIKVALNELEKLTGLAARDMHDKNVMMRPIDGAIVVVDVGMFKPRSEIREGWVVKETKKGLRRKFSEQITGFEVKMDDFAPKNTLNPDFWVDDDLDDAIRSNLLTIAKNFAEDIKINKALDDIIIVGSIASYNWTEKSDIDLHLVVDFEKLGEDEDFVEDLMRLHHNRWNNDHKILILGHEVEIYVQDVDHKGHYAGIYSLKHSEWEKMPQKETPEIDIAAVSNKAASIAKEIDAIHGIFKRGYYKMARRQADALKSKIRDMRSAGLDDGGAYSVENLAFKVLRNNAYMEKLSRLHKVSYDKSMSMTQTEPSKTPAGNLRINILKNFREAWAVKSGNKHGKPAGFGSLAKPKYMVSMDMAGKASEVVKGGEELYGWDKYAQLVAEAYEAAPEKDPRAAEAFERLGHHVIKNIKKVQSAYDVEFVDGQPYDSAEEMAQKMRETGVMQISKDFNQSEVFGEMENLYFRAVHDYYGHLAARGFESDESKITHFNLKGELRAYNGHLKMLGNSDMAKAVFTEVIGQACYFMYHGHFPDQKVAFLDDFDHINVGRVKGYDIVDQNLVSTVQEKKKRKKKKKKGGHKVTYSTNPRSRRGRAIKKTHWGVGSWFYGGGYGDAGGGDAGGE